MNHIEIIIPTFSIDDEIELILYKYTFPNLYNKDPTGIWVNCGHLINPIDILKLHSKYNFNIDMICTFRCSLCGEYLVNDYIYSNNIRLLKYGFLEILLHYSQYWNKNKALYK